MSAFFSQYSKTKNIFTVISIIYKYFEVALTLASFLLIKILEDNEAIVQRYKRASLTSTLVFLFKTDWMLAPSSRFLFVSSIPPCSHHL